MVAKIFCINNKLIKIPKTKPKIAQKADTPRIALKKSLLSQSQGTRYKR
jgi:hypothetical protein